MEDNELGPTVTDLLLFPEGEVAPTEPALEQPPTPDSYCVNCAAIEKADPGKFAIVDCGNHDWRRRQEDPFEDIALRLVRLGFPTIVKDQLKVAVVGGVVASFTFSCQALTFAQIDSLAVEFETRRINWTARTEEFYDASTLCGVVTVLEPVLD